MPGKLSALTQGPHNQLSLQWQLMIWKFQFQCQGLWISQNQISWHAVFHLVECWKILRPYGLLMAYNHYVNTPILHHQDNNKTCNTRSNMTKSDRVRRDDYGGRYLVLHLQLFEVFVSSSNSWYLSLQHVLKYY